MEQCPGPARDLAERTGVPVHYLGKVMRPLVVAKLVRGRKGHGGGFSLHRAPADITFAEILEAADVAVERGRCVFSFKDCDARAPCPLHSAWSRVQDVVDDWANTTTLAEARRAFESES